MTIAAHTHVHQRTVVDTWAPVGYENAHHRYLRAWLRDEEATPSTKVQQAFLLLSRSVGLRQPCRPAPV